MHGEGQIIKHPTTPVVSDSYRIPIAVTLFVRLCLHYHAHISDKKNKTQ